MELFSDLWATIEGSPDSILLLDILLALLLGFLFGYERSYQGRAAGMRTYGLVCSVAAAVTSVSVHPDLWLNGQALVNYGLVDPTRTIQGIVTGVGFLGGGIIMQHGMRISGLTTAASIWAVAAVGILVGVGLYSVAVLMTICVEIFILFGTRFDANLPARRPVMIRLKFKMGIKPEVEMIRAQLKSVGYSMADGSVVIHNHDGEIEWRFVAVSIKRRSETAIPSVSDALHTMDDVGSYQISRARN